MPSQSPRRAVVVVLVQRWVDHSQGYAPRLLESVVLQPGEKERLVKSSECPHRGYGSEPGLERERRIGAGTAIGGRHEISPVVKTRATS
jgi:hypothetical protein